MDTAKTILELTNGSFEAQLFEFPKGSGLALLRPWTEPAPIVRIHSQCLFGETFHSMHCDCHWQLEASLHSIATEGGLLIYLFQEGRGVGLKDKIRAMEIQRLERLDTVSAFAKIGHQADLRDYSVAIKILRHLCHDQSLRLFTNNPQKVHAVEKAGYSVERVELSMSLPLKVREAVKETREALGHFLSNSMVATPTLISKV